MSEYENGARVSSAALGLCVTGALLGGCTSAPDKSFAVTVIDQALAQQMSIDSQYMKQRLGTKPGIGASLRIDLADPTQHRFIANRLAAAGKTAKNSPYLFERLQKAKSRAVAQAKTGVTANATTANGIWCANFIVLGTEVKVGTSVQFVTTHPNVSCAGGASYVYADISTFNANAAGTENFLVASAAGEDYSGGTSFDEVTITPTLPAKLGRVNSTDSLVVAFDDLGNEQFTFHALDSDLVESPASIGLTHPTVHAGVANDGNLQICQLRGAPNQCDYAVGALAAGAFSPWNGATGMAAVQTVSPWTGDPAQYIPFPAAYDFQRLYIPLAGFIDAGAAIPVGSPAGTPATVCNITSILSASFVLAKNVAGGFCQTSALGLRTRIVIDAANPRRANFNTVADFANASGTLVPSSGSDADCLAENIIGFVGGDGSFVGDAVTPALAISMRANCGGALVTRVATLAWDSLPVLQPVLPYRVTFINSCFAEGTGIRRADGSRVMVETLKAGDKVISDSKGTVLTVTGVSHGGEREPLVHLRDDKGHELRVTSTHPIIKASGDVVFASTLKTGDHVMTDRGTARLVSVARVAYTGQVYNLSLGTPDEQAKVGKNKTTMFAEGFLVGDSTMQQALTTPKRTVARLSKDWQRELLHGMVANPRMKRVL